MKILKCYIECIKELWQQARSKKKNKKKNGKTKNETNTNNNTNKRDDKKNLKNNSKEHIMYLDDECTDVLVDMFANVIYGNWINYINSRVNKENCKEITVLIYC